MPQKLTESTVWVDKLQHFAFFSLWAYVNKDLNDKNILYSESVIDVTMNWISYWFEIAWALWFELVYDKKDINANKYWMEFWEKFYNNNNILPSDILKNYE